MSRDGYILCIDDDEDDCILLNEALIKSDPSLDLKFIMSGDEAVNFLTDAMEKQKLPKLITLDINMPGMNGNETLTHIKKLIGKNPIPIVFLTTYPGNDELFLAEKNHISVM